jgi:hypothetical protein
LLQWDRPEPTILSSSAPGATRLRVAESRTDMLEDWIDRLENTLDAFVDAQSAVNRRLLEYLDRQA